MMRIVPLLLLLASCSTPVYTPTTVDVPVFAKCTNHPTHAPYPLKQLPETASIYDKAKAAIIEIDLRQIYESQLEASLKGCAQ